MVRLTGGTARGRRLARTDRRGLRPTAERVRQALFSSLGPQVEGARVLDLFAGTGSLGLEALSRGASFVQFVERDPRLCATLRRTLADLGFEGRARVLCAPVEQALPFLPGPFHLILIDPPYHYPGRDRLLERVGASPLLAPGGLVVLEHSRRSPPAEASDGLRLVKRRVYGDTALSFYRREGEW